jgi:UDP-glucuronate 4-epimerase
MRVIVTGAAGFIGCHFARRLLAAGRGARVLGLDNLNDYYSPALKRARLAELAPLEGWEFVEGDFSDRATVDAVFSRFQPDHVVHLGAQAGVRYSVERPEAYVASNLNGFFNLLEASRAARVRHLVFASSSTVYGANTKIPFSEADPTDRAVSFYGATKKANEVMAHSYAHLHGLPMTGLRFFTVYGPWGRPDLGIAVFAGAIWHGRTLRLFNHGRNRRDFTYIDDVVDAMERLLALPPARGEGLVAGLPAEAPLRIYNVGNHDPVEILECVRLLERHLGRTARVELTPPVPADMPVTYADTALLRAAVGFAPRTSLDAGLARYCEWFRSCPLAQQA